MMRRGWTVLVGALLLLALGTGLSTLPVPYVALGPGPTVDTLGTSGGKPIITVKGRETSTSKGHLNLTTVSVTDGLDLGTAVRLWVDGDVAVVPRELVYPPGKSDREVDRENEEAFEDSQVSAKTAALRELGYPVEVRIREVTPGSPADGRLRAGDVITAVDGTPVTSRGRLVALVRDRGPGTPLTLSYTRGGQRGTVEVTTAAAKGDADRAVIGVALEAVQRVPFTVEFDLDRIGGPSAGLMFSLGVIDKLDPEDLTGGIFIAGTGTIDDDGVVGPIGGIQQKLVAADAVGAEAFLTPADNCADAVRAVPDGLRLVRVSTLDEALRALEQLRQGQSPPTCRR